MERLTKRDEFGNADIIGVDSEDLQLNLSFDEFNKVTVALNKLADYEDLEEQGLLLKPKCKPGDTVYVFLPRDNHFTVGQISKIENKPTIYGKMCYFIESVAHRGCLYRYFEYDFGKTVFLTQVEAEEALKRMEGEI